MVNAERKCNFATLGGTVPCLHTRSRFCCLAHSQLNPSDQTDVRSHYTHVMWVACLEIYMQATACRLMTHAQLTRSSLSLFFFPLVQDTTMSALLLARRVCLPPTLDLGGQPIHNPLWIEPSK
jgi:hypothetical protein